MTWNPMLSSPTSTKYSPESSGSALRMTSERKLPSSSSQYRSSHAWMQRLSLYHLATALARDNSHSSTMSSAASDLKMVLTSDFLRILTGGTRESLQIQKQNIAEHVVLTVTLLYLRRGPRSQPGLQQCNSCKSQNPPVLLSGWSIDVRGLRPQN